MGRLSAWIASRATTTLQGEPRRGRAARPLRFEACEQRIALSTNAAVEPAHHLLALPNEGGAVQITWVEKTISPRNATLNNSVFLGDADFFGAGLSLSADSVLPQPLGNSAFFSEYSYPDRFGGTPEVLVGDSGIQPIPPPTSPADHEGGQISMAPFMGPAPLGLPASHHSQLAAQTRSTLTPESPEAAGPGSSPAVIETLRGRAVVYEVAHVEQPAQGRQSAEAIDPLPHERIADVLKTPAQSHDVAVKGAAPRAELVSHSEAALRAEEPVDAASRIALTSASAGLAASMGADEATASASPDHAATARDHAFEQLQAEIEPVEHPVAAAATVDVHQRRVLGGLLIAVAGVPAAKFLRRQRRQAAEQHPRRRPAAL